MKTTVQIACEMFPKSTVTPPWFLFYWRLVRRETDGDYALAWQLLPARLPPQIAMPTIEECAVILVDHGLV